MNKRFSFAVLAIAMAVFLPMQSVSAAHYVGITYPTYMLQNLHPARTSPMVVLVAADADEQPQKVRVGVQIGQSDVIYSRSYQSVPGDFAYVGLQVTFTEQMVQACQGGKIPFTIRILLGPGEKMTENWREIRPCTILEPGAETEDDFDVSEWTPIIEGDTVELPGIGIGGALVPLVVAAAVSRLSAYFGRERVAGCW